ncbi:hypothetical protein HWV62_13992 [Athelia sp. TMB]|nr:hypothetical protein HWV62_13992 [Athelia sp. TMB]
MNEYFNRLLEAVVERKGAEFGAHFIRNRSGRHKTPHSRPEIRRLLDEYRKMELHYRRPGRYYPGSGTVVDNFSRGLEKLRGGTLNKWIKESLLFRNLLSKTASSKEGEGDKMDIDEEDEESEGEREDDDEPVGERLGQAVTLGCMEMIDGRLVIETMDLEEVDDIFADLEEDYDHTEYGD